MKTPRLIVSCLLLTLGLAALSPAQERYKLPPKDVVDILDAPPTPLASISPGGNLMVLVEYDSMPSIAHMARPMLRLAGLRITPQTNGRQRTLYYTGLTIQRLADGHSRAVKLPPGSHLSSFRWSPDGARIALTRETDQGIELWVADAESGAARRLTPPRLNATLETGFQWTPDSRQIICHLVPLDRGAAPQAPRVPKGPQVQETSGKFSRVRTYQDLLKNPHHEALFDYYMTSQLAFIDAATGRSRTIGNPGTYASVSPSPNGEFLLVQRIKHPYSYSVPYSDFAASIEVWNGEGKRVYTVADLPLADEVPIQGVRTGPRSVRWRPLRPATLYWTEALDGGDPKKKAPYRDQIMTVAAPFEAAPRAVYKLEQRYRGASWLTSGHQALITEFDRRRRWRTTKLVDVDDPTVKAKVIFDLSIHDRYGDPGAPVTTTTDRGEQIIVQDGNWIYLSGRGATPEGDRPRLQRMNLQTLEKEELFRSGPTSYETFLDFVGGSRWRIVSRHESKTEPPNYFVRDLNSGQRRALTHFKDPAPQLTGLKKQLVKYTREDGVPLSGTLYLPPGYTQAERLPLVLWAYPLEYSNARTAGQVRSSPNRFTRLRGASQLFFLTQGYAVLDGAQMPVIGDPDEVNDTFVQQIVMSAEAAIKKLDEMGVIDPNRVGVGGHSYGAFMTANLLAHSDLFRAAIARSGAYNRTLTPFGFQSEPRTLWEAPEIYFKVSPFMHANKINEPILLIHGEMDNNSGTFPIQSQRLFHALKGHGATARLVMLPYESHGYRARESVLDTLAEMFEWFDRYVKNAGVLSKRN